MSRCEAKSPPQLTSLSSRLDESARSFAKTGSGRTQRILREEETKRKAFFAQDTIGMAVEFKYRYTDGT
jgi:hypothetical protein